MATFGIEVITNFDKYRKFSKSSTHDLPYAHNEANSLYKKLRQAGHIGLFYFTDNDCWERDLRSKTIGIRGEGLTVQGIDDKMADNVNLFYIFTHGTNDGKFTHLTYNSVKESHDGISIYWRLGDGKLKWLIMASCSTINPKNLLSWLHIFENLHEICGAYKIFFGFEDMGEKLGQKLIDGHTVTDAWLDSTQSLFWRLYNPSIVVAAENQKSWNDGKPLWALTTINNDHLLGHGTTMPDISNKDIRWLSYIWVET